MRGALAKLNLVKTPPKAGQELMKVWLYLSTGPYFSAYALAYGKPIQCAFIRTQIYGH